MKLHTALWVLIALGLAWLVQSLGPVLVGALLAFGIYRFFRA
jgi:hypothetical protein